MNVPNLLTGARLVIVPVFVGFFLRGERKAALGVFIGHFPKAERLRLQRQFSERGF